MCITFNHPGLFWEPQNEEMSLPPALLQGIMTERVQTPDLTTSLLLVSKKLSFCKYPSQAPCFSHRSHLVILDHSHFSVGCYQLDYSPLCISAFVCNTLEGLIPWTIVVVMPHSRVLAAKGTPILVNVCSSRGKLIILKVLDSPPDNSNETIKLLEPIMLWLIRYS